jgi:hypothetical protein
MKSENRQYFEVQSYIGTDIADITRGERPPRSAKLVVELDMGGCPGYDLFRGYLLSTNRERSSWILWLEGNHPDGYGRPFLYCRMAEGRPYRGYTAKFAAEQLLIKSWQDERDKWGLDRPCGSVLRAGLLKQKDINRIKVTVFGEETIS